MPLNPQLLARAEHNERFLVTFDIATTPFLDWAVVVAFNQSREARYELSTFTAQGVQELMSNRLNHVTSHMRRQ